MVVGFCLLGRTVKGLQLCSRTGYVIHIWVTDIAGGHLYDTPIPAWAKALLGLLDHKDEGATIRQNGGNYVFTN